TRLALDLSKKQLQRHREAFGRASKPERIAAAIICMYTMVAIFAFPYDRSVVVRLIFMPVVYYLVWKANQKKARERQMGHALASPDDQHLGYLILGLIAFGVAFYAGLFAFRERKDASIGEALLLAVMIAGLAVAAWAWRQREQALAGEHIS